MASTDVAAWVDRYINAWSSNDPGEIGGLFSDEARYYTAPHRPPWSGREEIVREWLNRKDEPGQWTFRYEVIAEAGDLAFVRGWTAYLGDEAVDYSNLWVIQMDGGRCSEFTEWWMKVPTQKNSPSQGEPST